MRNHKESKLEPCGASKYAFLSENYAFNIETNFISHLSTKIRDAFGKIALNKSVTAKDVG